VIRVVLCLALAGLFSLWALSGRAAPDPSGWDPDLDAPHSDDNSRTTSVPDKTPAVVPGQTTFQLQATQERQIGDPRLRGMEQPVRPPWIPDNAYSNAKLTFVSCKTSRYGLLPNVLNGSGNATVAQDIVQFWDGIRPNPCVVRYEPDPKARPGNFIFQSVELGGPRGWCVYAGTNELGFPVYQYWFAYPSEQKLENR